LLLLLLLLRLRTVVGEGAGAGQLTVSMDVFQLTVLLLSVDDHDLFSVLLGRRFVLDRIGYGPS
jgi:hypothetical protein